jgi:hypothetical protein
VHNYFAKVNRRPASASGSLGVASFFARARVKYAKVFFASMVEVAILSAFFASHRKQRGNFQVCGAWARRAMAANPIGGR